MPFATPAPLHTERLTLRIMEERDLAALQAYYTDPLYLRYLPNTAWTSLEDAHAWFHRLDARRREGAALQFVIEDKATGAVLGICLLFNLDDGSQRAELGYALGPAHQGKGYAREAVKRLIEFAFDELGLRRLDATVDPRNAASARVLTDFGFVHEGTKRENVVMKGEVVSSALYGLLQREWRG